MSISSIYGQVEDTTSNNLMEFGKKEEKARKKSMENPAPESIAKYKKANEELMNAAEKFAEEYCKDNEKP